LLVVRRAQVAVFRSDVERRFAERMREIVARAYPDHHAALGEEGTRALIARGIEAGERYGLGDDQAVAELILLMVELGERLERFPERSWAEGMLSDRGLPGQIRVKAVRARLTDSTGGRRMAPFVASPRAPKPQVGTD
jgi:hypothetical protein